jgi:signal transduction histidine kinase/NO-binding membrane sensor protein with MHYT domain
LVLSHQPVLVALSLIAVVVSATTASILAVRAGRAQHGRIRTFWQLGAAISLAAGIWSMHFIGMVALQFPFPVGFQPYLTAASFLPALAAGLGLVSMARRQRRSGSSEAIISGLTALGVVAMHYSGMLALMVQPAPEFAPWSILVAFGIAWVTCLLAFRSLRAALRAHTQPSALRFLATGLTLGLAASGMHYAAMAGTQFSAALLPVSGQLPAGALDQSLSALVGQHVGLALLIFMLLVTVNLIGILVSVFDHRLEDAHRRRAEDLALANRQLDSRARRLSLELAREKTVFEAAVDATQDCIWSWQPDTHELFLSTHLHGLLGTDPHYSMATIEELEVRLHREDRPEFRKAFQAAVADPLGEIRLKARLRQSDGGWRWVLFRARMVRPRPKAPAMLVGAISDIQAQQHAEEEARQLAEQQREIAHLRSRIVRILSHELRTPLAVVTTSAELIETFAQARSEEQKPRLERYFENIHQALQKIESILNDALQFNRLETGDRIVCFDWVSPVALVQEAARWACDGQKKPRSLVQIRDHGFHAEVQSDARLLELALRNLLTNALKYGQDKPVTVEFLADEDRLCIDFIDQGLGIPESQQAQLFRAFFRGNNVGMVPGTGLGLSIARRAVEACGGELLLVTSSAQGSRFRLVLHGSPRRINDEPGT